MFWHLKGSLVLFGKSRLERTSSASYSGCGSPGRLWGNGAPDLKTKGGSSKVPCGTRHICLSQSHTFLPNTKIPEYNPMFYAERLIRRTPMFSSLPKQFPPPKQPNPCLQPDAFTLCAFPLPLSKGQKQASLRNIFVGCFFVFVLIKLKS